MALHATLSAIKELILDIDNIPADFKKRAALYSNKFSELSENEIEDLAKIDPERLKIYTTTVFNGEAGYLEINNRISLELIKKHWTKFSAETFSYDKIARWLHKYKPWDSNRAYGYAKLFCDFIDNSPHNFTAHIPEISDLARLELLSLEIRRHPDADMEARDSLQYKDLESLTVPEVLSLNFSVPGCARFEAFEYDVVSLFGFFYGNDETLPAETGEIKTCAAGSRTVRKTVRWINLPEPVFKYLEKLPRGSWSPIDNFAMLSPQIFPDAETEEELFGSFISLLAPLLNSGVLILKPGG